MELSVDLERALLSLLTDNTNMSRAHAAGAREGLFDNAVNKKIYISMVSYWLTSGRKKCPTFEVIDYDFAVSLPRNVGESVEWLVSSLQDQYLTNKLNSGMLEVAKETKADPKGAARKMFNLAFEGMKTTSTRTNRSDLSKNIDLRRLRYQRSSEMDSVKGAPTGIIGLDEHFGGIKPGHLAVIAAGPKTGKTNLLAKSVISATVNGWKVYFASLELSIKETENRIDAIGSGVPLTPLEEGRLNDFDHKDWQEWQEEFATYGSIIVEKLPRGQRTVSYIMSRARELGCNYVVIDQLSWLEGKGNSQKDKYANIMADLKADCSEDEDDMLAVLMAVQLNREGLTKDGENLTMSHIAGAAEVEQFSDHIFGMVATAEDKLNYSMKFHILGSRHCQEKSWYLEWKMNTSLTRLGEVRNELQR